MAFYIDLERRKSIVRDYLRAHPKATFREIKLKLHTKINKVYSGGLEDAYKDAGIKPPRTFIRRTMEEKKQILIEYVRKNPGVGGHIIRRDTKINTFTVFKSTKDLYSAAGVYYPREQNVALRLREIKQKREEIINLIKKDPFLSIEEIGKIVNSHPYAIFRNIQEIYKEAGIPYLGKGAKRRETKRNIVINFIKENKFATQRDINRACKTKVQDLFEKGIFDAYKSANIEFPYERLNLHGAAIGSIKLDAIIFEKLIARKLLAYGGVNQLVKTKRGIADIIFERKDRKAVIEIKNYKSHEISISQVNQLNKYVEDIDAKFGFLVCLRKPKKDTFLMGDNRLFILTESELCRIPEIMDKDL